MAKEAAASITKQFQQFDVVTDYSDHNYAGLNPPVSTGSAVYKVIMKEWKMLTKNLPESIYVRVYEGRIDLLRAVIVGPSGTPYHNGLFLFDFAFPPDYPNVPPKAYYKSFGFRLNPNLYNTGFICLSLLNTWYGQRWEPRRSSILQVLVSLQALVLNEKPFFNEPGIAKVKWLEKESRRYNNAVFVMSCKTMMLLLQRPPRNFKDFIVEHFRSHGHVILTACKAYTAGFVRVGHYQDDTSFLPKRVHVSNALKESMNWLYPRLVAAFAENDPSLMIFIEQLDLMIAKTKYKYIQKDKENKNRKIEKFFRILKKIFVLNTCAKSNADGIETKSSQERSNQVDERGRKGEEGHISKSK